MKKKTFVNNENFSFTFFMTCVSFALNDRHAGAAMRHQNVHPIGDRAIGPFVHCVKWIAVILNLHKVVMPPLRTTNSKGHVGGSLGWRFALEIFAFGKQSIKEISSSRDSLCIWLNIQIRICIFEYNLLSSSSRH